MVFARVFVLLLVALAGDIHGFQFHGQCPRDVRFRSHQRIFMKKAEPQLGGNALSRSLFAATELFGRLVSGTGSVGAQARGAQRSTASTIGADANNRLLAISEVIRQEYEAIFWATGNMDTSLWADDCVFSDPFSSFGGRPGSTARFKSNADNLGKLVDTPTLRITSFAVDEGVAGPAVTAVKVAASTETEAPDVYDVVKVGWTFSSKLKLPWRPVLAAAGETTHYLDARGLIVRYEERWKSDPWSVVRRLFVPT